jgi:hypothetical protein
MPVIREKRNVVFNVETDVSSSWYLVQYSVLLTEV